MKKILLTLECLSFLLANKAFAQTTATADVYMKVNGSVTLTKVRDLDMGIVVQGITSVSIDPITGGGLAACFLFEGEENSSVTVSFTSANLTSGTDNISFTGALAGCGSSEQSDATPITSGNPVITNPDGNYYFWAGGTAELSPDQPFGIYTGSFTLSIAY